MSWYSEWKNKYGEPRVDAWLTQVVAHPQTFTIALAYTAAVFVAGAWFSGGRLF